MTMLMPQDVLIEDMASFKVVFFSVMSPAFDSLLSNTGSMAPSSPAEEGALAARAGCGGVGSGASACNISTSGARLRLAASAMTSAQRHESHVRSIADPVLLTRIGPP